MIELAERSRDDEIDRVENGLPDEEEVEEPEEDVVQTKWNEYQALSNEEYL